MKSVVIVLLALFCLSVYASDVIVLNKKNFDDVISKNDVVLVEFYAPWCGHCKQLAPIFEKVATALKADNIPVAKIDASKKKNAKFNEKYGIEGFPTLMVFKNGKAFKIQPDRTEASIAAAAKRFAGPAVKTLASADDLKSFTQAPYVVVGVFDKEANAKEYASFIEASETLRADFSFGEVLNKDVATGAELSAPSVVVFRSFDEPRVPFSGDYSAKDIVQFVQAKSLPVVGEVTQGNYQKYLARGLPWAWMFLDKDNADALAATIAAYKQAVTGLESKFNFVYLDGKRYGDMAKQYGLSTATLPAFAIEAEGRHYILEQDKEVNTENVKQTLDSFLAGTLPQKIRSQAVPTSDDGPVKVVVANNFAEVVLDESKDVLVEFYAPWCGHCQKLAPIYDELAKHFESNPNIVIAKLDSTENDVDPKYGIEGFPTLLFFPAGNKTPIPFSDKRDLATLTKFVEANAKSAKPETKEENKKDEL